MWSRCAVILKGRTRLSKGPPETALPDEAFTLDPKWSEARMASFKAAEGDIKPLQEYLLSEEPLTAKDRKDIAWALEKLLTRGRRPPGPIGDVERAEEKAAYEVARRRDEWIANHPGRMKLKRGAGLEEAFAKQAIEQLEVAPDVKAKISTEVVLTRLKKIRLESTLCR